VWKRNGYRNIEVVPKITTVATAMALLYGSALRTGSVAKTAAAPQTALPDEINNDVSRSRPKTF